MHHPDRRATAAALHRDRDPGRLATLIGSIMVALLLASPAPAQASATYAPACSSVNIRTSASTSAAIRVRLSPSDRVTVAATVTGSHWATACPGLKSGAGWYRISAINGRSVSSLYGLSALYGATGVLTSVPAPAATAPAPTATPAPTPTPGPTAAPAAPSPTPAQASATYAPACSSVNIRTSASTSAAIRVRLSPSDRVTVAATVTGSHWATACPGLKSGAGWYRISAINGRSVSSLYGLSALYGATGVLTSVPAPAATAPAPTATRRRPRRRRRVPRRRRPHPARPRHRRRRPTPPPAAR